ncbi:MAG: 4-hydroxythreonine-4-phosphate dehydrogenase PdxA [Rhizobiaceae bacterium]
MSGLPIAVSMGDPSGIGPDTILTAWNEYGSQALPNFFVVGNGDFLKRRSEKLGLKTEISEFNFETHPKSSALPVLETGLKVTGSPGIPDQKDADGTTRSIELAVDAVFENQAAAVVTCPINKEVLYSAGFKHPGHTEFLAELAKSHTGEDVMPVMMLAGPELRTVPVTIHVPVHEVPGLLTKELVVDTIEIVGNDVEKLFGIPNPRIALAGLNPHAGENGCIGMEEVETIIPAVEELKAKGFNVKGPLPADTMFHPSARQTYDVAVCMYHDQALIPAKMLGFEDAVNVTLGLPFIRTSPDHGTAYDIAGSGKANPSSFIAALNLAAKMVARF